MTARLVRGRWVEDGKRDDSLVEQMRKGRGGMSERLSDEQLTSLDYAACDDYAHEQVTKVRPQALRALVAELRERRAADQNNTDQARHWQRETERVKQDLANERQAAMLSDEDRAALAWLRNCVDTADASELSARSLALLDRLLSRGKDGR